MSQEVLNSESTPGSANRIKLVVSVCERKDMGAWKIASGRITRYIESDAYWLVCPDSQAGEFKSASDPRWEVIEESRFVRDFGPDAIREIVHGHNVERVHWLFQQFLKIRAILESGLEDDDLVLIWDADTVPLREIRFWEPGSDAIHCYYGKERHLPYFATIARLLDINPEPGKSFIAQCLPVRKGWVREMVAEVERKFSTSFEEAILRVLPGQSGSEFSEYETIGAWVMENHPDRLVFKTKNLWLRSGRKLLGRNPSPVRLALVLWMLSLRYDFVAVETWSRPLDFARFAGWIKRTCKLP